MSKTDKGWIYHFDDGAIDCLYGTGACSKLTARWINKLINATPCGAEIKKTAPSDMR